MVSSRKFRHPGVTRRHGQAYLKIIGMLEPQVLRMPVA